MSDFKPTEEKELVRFFSELGHLRHIKHEGWRLVGVTQPPSVAEHTLRACHIAYVLAVLEEYKNPAEVVSIVAFHDMAECRIGDLHKVAAKYVVADEERVVREQTQQLGLIGNAIFELWQQAENRSSIAGNIAKDADLLEQALTAREYKEIGYLDAQDWIINSGKRLQTSSAKKLHSAIMNEPHEAWWRGLKQIPPS